VKLTKTQLKQLLKEEITKVFETHGGLERAASLVRDPENPMAKGYERPSHSYEQVMDLVAKFIEGMSEEEALDWAKELIGDPERPYSGFMKTAERPLDLEKLKEIIKEELSKTLSEIAVPPRNPRFDGHGGPFRHWAPSTDADAAKPWLRDKPYEIAQWLEMFDDITNDLIADAVDYAIKSGFVGGDEGSGEESTWVNNPDDLHHEVVQRLGFNPGEGMPDDYASARPKKAPPSRAWLKRKEMSKEWLAAEAEKEKIKKQQNYN